MCGICGQFNFANRKLVCRATIERMARSIAHRGPDDEGYYLSGSIGLGFRRLSIIDLTGGHQPMSDGEGSVWVIFNGEIYNFPELKDELQRFGHIFRTTSDTEVIVHGYKQWGADVLNHLNGMFGLAIWDVKQERLIVARDPFGIKLIYYRIEAGALVFASEIRGVLAANGEEIAVDPEAVNLFLRYRYTPSPHTLYKGVKKLAPGTMLIVEKGTCKVTRWYKYRPEPFSPMKSDAEAVDELAALYKRAMKRHLLSDVPLGLLLSGGVDSALLLALMNMFGSSWNTYTVGYGATFSDDELIDAQQTAREFGAKHTSVLLDRKAYEQMLPLVVSQLEEPIASSSIVPMYVVCKRAREDVKVAIVGQGPDELFGGYRRHLGLRYAALWANLPRAIRTPIASCIALLPRNETLKRGVYALDVRDRLPKYQHVLSLLPGTEIDGLFRDGLLSRNIGDAMLECWSDLAPLLSRTDELGGLQFLELRSTLPDELLMFADKLSMAHGLEVRVPYLDRDVVEYAERLSARFKVRSGSQKWLHRQVCKRLLPKFVLGRKKKGFAVNVVDDWFRSAISSKMNDILLDESSCIYQYLRPRSVRNLLTQHLSGRSNNYKVLFSIVVFEEWLRTRVPAREYA